MELAGCLSLKDLVSTKKSKVDSSIDGRSSQKENMYDRFRISPRASFKSEPIDLSKQKAFTPDRIPITPVKVMEPPQTDPLTPTANLKMLISVASPEIRDWEKKKELFRPIENNEQDDAAPCSQQFDAVDDMDELEKRPSRKQKSLGLLCQKFLARYPSYPMSTEKTTISLDEAAASLGVERRRIYDIVNVLESLNLVSRVAKNQYCWHGQHNLNETLKGLQQLGESHKYEDQIAYFQHKELYNEPKCQERRKEFLVDSQNISLLELPDADGPSATTSSRKDKSLRIMSQKFVMLFLASSTKIITLEIAAKILIEEGQDAADYSKFKTKVRRLYDIANVLTSLGLIKKVYVTEERGRKPAFKWIGPADFKASEDQRMPVSTNTQSSDYKREVGILLSTDVNRKDRMSRHSSFNMVQTSNTAKRKVCSEPSSPCKVQNVGTGSSDVYSSKMAHLAAVCQQKIEEDSKRQNSSPENTMLENISPFPVMVPVDSEYSCTSIADQGSNLLQKAINGQFVSVPSPVSSTEQNQHGFLPNQPYVYVPSSVFMLYGKLGEENMLRVEKENSNRQTPERPDHAFPVSVVKYKSYPSENDRFTKRQRIDLVDAPPSLMQQMEIIQSTNAGSPQMNWETTIAPKSVSPCRDEETNVISKAVCPEDAGTARISHVGKPVPEEGVQPAPLPPYLYLTSAAGLNGFNFFLPANQAAGALGLSPSQLASLNVPCMVVPSSSVAGLPFICSPAVANPQASAPAGSSPSHIGMNLNIPRMAPATPLFIGASPVMATKISELSQDLLPSVSSEYESPVQRVGSTSVKGDSAVCASQPATVVKSQKLTTPLTPKSIRPAQKETFFKTPSGVGVPSYFRKSEGAHYSSAQRRLEISSSSSD